jgi:DNA mismatch endonuclease (patch repair protein)
VNGCFWHRHRGCSRCRMPKSHIDFWRTKLNGNRKRDQRLQKKLARLGWEVLIIWECQTDDSSVLKKTIRSFLGSP